MTTYIEACAKLILEHGTEEEIERLQAGVLPEKERDLIVGDILFGPVADWLLRRQIEHRDIKLLAAGQVSDRVRDLVEKRILDLATIRKLAKPTDHVTFETVEATELTADHWRRLKALRELMPEADQVAAFCVILRCGQYKKRLTYAKILVTCGDRVRRQDVNLDEDPAQAPEVLRKRG